MLIAIWAMTQEGLIGNNNTLPWMIKQELAHFKKTTLFQALLMGRKTYESLPKVFEKRTIFLLSKDQNYRFEEKGSEVKVINDFWPLIKSYQANKEKDLFICGGKSVYEQTINECDQLIVSIIKKKYKGDQFLKVDLSKFVLNEVVEFEEFNVNYYRKKQQ
ncbi:dihydrofolate reductase [Mycoplasmoides genitalium]|uniref:Dihydrofolate reductase n=2 Tax=Mycoplasmoides genitalium TaxID=2097 RepID=DYR_MYCGE|nr:dihydrofolate reductase [Mycoplasmoides genitalium]P47470.1 RecName: Full=Dihydrofolate reductase [Mycoplasmoides genitalium G37]ABY79469.1 dihydrofolate reductase [synthetic Mycoplasma genitalium JCVI-1.0]AAC71449.1 dihydrofolate reductase [Mycoplasmoides genitalium G37]AFQ03059.1 dihydrofolate reductase [Mycoplasmoides genitalium M2321]AFQ04050.1 dihydrofolate reductase [Mycoplasmoides genitalium M6320]AFQ04551.1 dihydrofolate reductase [Mycoplasmoides genitalium M2288]